MLVDTDLALDALVGLLEVREAVPSEFVFDRERRDVVVTVAILHGSRDDSPGVLETDVCFAASLEFRGSIQDELAVDVFVGLVVLQGFRARATVFGFITAGIFWERDAERGNGGLVSTLTADLGFVVAGRMEFSLALLRTVGCGGSQRWWGFRWFLRTRRRCVGSRSSSLGDGDSRGSRLWGSWIDFRL